MTPLVVIGLFVLVLALAKRKGRGRGKFRPYLRGNIDIDQNLGTLAAKTGIVFDPADTLEEKAWLSSVKATYTMNQLTPASGQGPIAVFIAHSDYTLAEIEAWIEQADSWAQGDKIAQEVRGRKIRRVGTFATGGDNPSALGSFTLNGGRPVRTKCGWQLTTGQTVRFVWYNLGAAALATTDPDIHVQGHANLWPN